ncbi:MAG: glycosyltransferase family 4 protein [Hyphomicrobium sp.]|jgi:glycosyltransferase involved in cell wall biosynthesis
MRILLLNKTRSGEFRTFDYSDIEALRGAERTNLYLAEAMGARGHEVVLASSADKGSLRQGSVQLADPVSALASDYDVAISNNYAHAFAGADAPLKLVWTHNPGFSWNHVKADYAAKLRHLPYLVHLSKYTLGRSWFLPRSGQTIIHHGMPANLLAARKLRTAAPPPVAVFASYAGRNLRTVIKAWRDVVHPSLPAARLLVTAEVEPKHLGGVDAAELKRLNVEIVGTLPWSELMDLLRGARVLVAPGHFQETYNLLSVEAAACGVPTVTMGIGALRERVVHDEGGWIASSIEEMGAALARILTHDELWLRYHRACLAHPDLVSWGDRAAEWEDYIGKLQRP